MHKNIGVKYARKNNLNKRFYVGNTTNFPKRLNDYIPKGGCARARARANLFIKIQPFY